MRPSIARTIGAGLLAAVLWAATALLAQVPIGPRPLGWIAQVLVPGPLVELAALPIAAQAAVVVIGALVLGVLVTGAALLARGPIRVPVVWLAVPLAAFVVGLAMGLGQVLGVSPRLGVSFPVADVARSLGVQAWGLLVGWAPAFVAGWSADGPSRRIPGTVLGVAAPLLVSALVASMAVAAPLRYAALDHRAAASPAAPSAPATASPSTASATPGDDLATTDCPADRLVLAGTGGGAATGHREYDLEIRNDSGRVCRLTGYPGVVFRGAAHRVTAATVTPGRSFMAEDPGAVPVTLAPGGMAVTSLGWDAGAEPADPTASTTVELVVATGARPIDAASDPLDVVDGTTVFVTAWHAGALDGDGG
ncbi:DUF4232 domain-containing protein [Pseudolysinimonas sp.]|uniref:DUF4232 domain-containing protein n=1 Tax=Pseudolysinimonas sp. TaxID=2680009 RepID=UPI003F7D597D